MYEFLVFALVGFLAQLVDGALGMAYGVVSSSVLLAYGIPPANVSASVHAAQLFTSGASAASHIGHKNVRWPLFRALVLAGMLGGVAGAFFLTSVDASAIKPFIVIYLGLMGLLIVWRAWRTRVRRNLKGGVAAPVGFAGGFLTAVGGGGWGPTVTGTLVGAGAEPRYAVGTSNSAEFFVSSAITASFVTALVTGHWSNANGLMDHAYAVLGLIAGGVCAAPIAGYVTKIIPFRIFMWVVGLLIMGLSLYQSLRLLGMV